MMTTRIASKRNHRKPRLKHWSMKAETLGDLLFESFIFQVPVVHIHATHWEKFTKNPCWWKRFQQYLDMAVVTCLAVIPPELGKDNFGFPAKILYVPAGSVEVYRKNAVWREAFETIAALP